MKIDKRTVGNVAKLVGAVGAIGTGIVAAIQAKKGLKANDEPEAMMVTFEDTAEEIDGTNEEESEEEE